MIRAGHYAERIDATEDDRRAAQSAVLNYCRTHETQEAAAHFGVPVEYILSARGRYKRRDGADACPGYIIHDILRRAMR